MIGFGELADERIEETFAGEEAEGRIAGTVEGGKAIRVNERSGAAEQQVAQFTGGSGPCLLGCEGHIQGIARDEDRRGRIGRRRFDHGRPCLGEDAIGIGKGGNALGEQLTGDCTGRQLPDRECCDEEEGEQPEKSRVGHVPAWALRPFEAAANDGDWFARAADGAGLPVGGHSALQLHDDSAGDAVMEHAATAIEGSDEDANDDKGHCCAHGDGGRKGRAAQNERPDCTEPEE